MRPLKEDEVQHLATHIQTNMNTCLQILKTLDPTEKGVAREVRDTRTTQVLLGCVAMGLNTIADVLLATAERSLLITPNDRQ